MKVTATISIPSADSYGNGISPSVTFPELETMSTVTDWILSWSKQIKPGVTIKIEVK